MIKPLERVTPESVGLSSRDVLEYIEALEDISTEMHGIMITRHGKVLTEGWWEPYSPYLHHALQSLTKTYTATAIGILVDEGKLHLDDNVAEILKDHFPKDALPCAANLTLRNLLTMYSGVEEITFASSDTWIEDFFKAIKVEPGSKWCYSGMCTAMLGAVINAVTGEGIKEFLTPRVFDKIGIDPSNIKWIEHSSGLEYCGGGIMATTEDNLRLGLTYLNMGEFDGQRIVSADWVREATRKQVDNPNHKGEIGADDESSGYGYQVWCSKVPGNYMFWGAHGQYILNIPAADISVSMTQFVDGPGGDYTPVNELKIFDLTWKLADKAVGGALPEDPENLAKLQKKMAGLTLDRRPSGPVPPEAYKHSGESFAIEENPLSILPNVYGTVPGFGICVTQKLPVNISELGITMDGKEVTVKTVCGGKPFEIKAGLDGINRVTYLDVAHDLPNQVLTQGLWLDENTLRLYLRFIETCYEDIWTIKFGSGQSLTIDEFALFTDDGWMSTTLKAKP